MEDKKSVCIVPALYFKSFQKYTEGRIPFECLNLTGVIEKNGFKNLIVDFNIKADNAEFESGNIIFPKLNFNKDFYKKAVEILKEQNANIYVFLVTIHTTGNYFHSLEIAKELKKIKPNVLIIFGGLGASSTDIPTLKKYREIDIIIRGENELILDQILKGINNNDYFENINDITYISRKDNKIIQNPERPLIDNLDLIPCPNYEFYQEPIKMLTGYTECIDNILVEENIHVEAGRGCYYNCKFCSNPKLWRRKVRFKSVDRLIKEIEICIEKYHAKNFCFHAQLFTAKKEFVIEFCNKIIEKKFNINWSCFTRANFVDEELLKKMAESGCKTILYGIESGSQKVLNDINKNESLEEELKNVELTKKYNIKPQLSFIIGFPTENEEDLEKTLNLYIKYKFDEKAESQIGLLAPVGYSCLLDEYNDKLKFDGIGTTTWNTRFFTQNSMDEIEKNKEIFPQNFYFDFENVNRKKIVFIKMLDIAMSYMRMSIKNIILNEKWTLNNLYIEYTKWNKNDKFSWDSELNNILYGVYTFIKENIIEKSTNKNILNDLLEYEYNYAIINNLAKDIFYEKYCNKIDVEEEKKYKYKDTIELNYDINDIKQLVEEKKTIQENKMYYKFDIIDSNHIKVINYDKNKKKIKEKNETVFNYAEY